MRQPPATSDGDHTGHADSHALHRFTARDGTRLAYRQLGSGPTFVLLHGLFADSHQWLEHGHAQRLACRGRRVILPDLRGHGHSDRSHDPHDYPPDVLTEDGLDLLKHLGLSEDPAGFALGGYSLGARIALRMLVRGATPTRAVIAGQGLSAVMRNTADPITLRALNALAINDTIDPASPEAHTAQWITHLHADPRAALNVLDSLVATTRSQLRTITAPTLIATGEHDHHNATATDLAAALTAAHAVTVPGDHWSALTQPELMNAIATFLDTEHTHASVTETGRPAGRQTH